MNNINLLGLDLSLASTGYCVIKDGEIIEVDRVVTEGKELSPRSKKHLDYTYFFANVSEDERLYYLACRLDEITKKHNITDFIIEDQYIGCNPKTGLTLSKVKGAIIYIGKHNGVNIHHLKPTEVRANLFKRGGSDKEMVARYIRNTYYDAGEFSKKYNKFKTDDLYDALGCAIAYCNKSKIRVKKKDEE
ncbi:Holliday junction resolvase [[Clostridium] sordellii]|uniref:crossover junction endodeoxyribonuclease RuvC n=1 Tax=Paraclostridium sordellii TaxID=1505 RepID=UPI0005E73D8E|nr:crossover junction endodeoxyribonuclease RuvC [Paeniclostridium sordellii]CEQ01594.1 Holliday junction resolvase [[Clostridium] sordellii] [Paeniclostridium sordellii]